MAAKHKTRDHFNGNRRERWEAIRSDRKWPNIILMGCVLGIVATLIMACVSYLHAPAHFAVLALVPRVPVMLLIGFIVAMGMWEFVDHRYHSAEVQGRTRGSSRREGRHS